MTTSNITEQALRDYREQAERTSDEPLSRKATRPGRQRAEVLSVRLTPEEFDELNRYAAALDVPLRRSCGDGFSTSSTCRMLDPSHRCGPLNGSARQLKQLRRQLVA